MAADDADGDSRGRSGGDGSGRGVVAYARGSARQWAPYVGVAALVFLVATVAGAATGATEPSAFVPEVGAAGGDALDSFLYLLSVAAVMIVGGGFVTLPTFALLGLQGYQFGGSLATLAASAGTVDALIAAAPAAVLALPALWLVAAIPLRGLHYGARMVRETPPPDVRTERLVGEAVAMAVLAILALWVAVTLAAGGVGA